MSGWFCWFAVVSAAVQPALSGVGCLWCRPGRGWCSAGACSPPCWGVPCLCVAPPLVGRAVLVAACCDGGVGFGLSLGCGCGCVVGLAGVGVVLVRAHPLVGACRVCACPPPWLGVLRRRLGVLVGGVVAGWMPGWFCWFAVVSAAARPALSGVGYLCCLPGRGWCCAGACPHPWWGVLRWVVALLMVGRAVLVHAPPLAGVCCVGARLPRRWCLVWVAVACWVGCGCGCVVGLAGVGAVLVRAPPPPCWGVPCLCVAPPLVGRAVLACSGFVSWCCSRLDAQLVLLVRCCLRRCTAGVVGCWLSVVLAWPGLVLCWCVLPPLLGRTVLVPGPPLWWGVLFWCVAPLSLGRAVLVAACCGVGVWFGLSLGCGCGCVVGLAGVGVVLVRAHPPVGACRVCAWPPPWWGVLRRRLGVLVGGVVAGCMPGWFCWFAVVSAAARPALLGVGYLCCFPGRGWCCAGACPRPWWGVLRWVVALLMAGRAVLVHAPPLAGVCCVGARLPRWWCLVWVVVASLVGCGCGCVVGLAGVGAVLVRAPPPPPVGACRVCAWPPPWWGVLCRRVRVSVRGVVAGWMLSLFCWSAVVSAAVRPALLGVCCLWCVCGRGRCCVGACPPLCWGMPCLCVAPPLVGPAVSACLGFGSWCCSRLDARHLLLVCCCLRRRMAGVVGCCRSVVFSWPGRTGRPPERVWCAIPLSWPGRTGRPPERVRCATPCFCCAGVVALLLVVPCSLVSVRFQALRWCVSLPAAVPPPPPRPSACCLPPPPLLLGVPRPPAVVPPPPPGGYALPGWLSPAPRLPLLPLCLVVALRCLAVCWCFLLPPPPPPRVVFPGCWPLPLVFPCPPAYALFFPCLWLWHLFGWVSFSPLGSRWCPPPPPRRLLVVCGAPRLGLWCCSWVLAVVCGARCFAAPCCVGVRVPCCVVRSSVVPLAVSLWRWPGPFCWCRLVLCFAVLFCAVFRRVWCLRVLSCALVFSLLLCGVVVVLSLPSRFCAHAGLRRLVLSPPPLVCVSCLLPVCVAAVCWLVLPFVVLCCCLLCCVVRGAACRVVLCRVLLCSAGGVVLRCGSSCGCVLLRALPCSVVLCCVVVRCAVRCSAASWCSVLCCPAVCCRGLLCAVWCPLALRGWLRAVLRCCLLLCAVLRLWAWCLVALCCAVLVVACCFVLVALPRAVLCLLVLCWAVSRRVVLCGAVLLCTALWGWHCAALFRGLWCRFPLWCALGCCAVPRVLCALLRAVLCCCVLCCAPGCRVLVRCPVLFASCPAVWSRSVFLCGVLCLLVLWCSALHLVVSCGVVLLRTGLFAWCCAVFARVVWCCCLLCPALGCCAALWGAVPFGAVLCCAAPCCACCAVCVLPLCCRVCCFCCCPLCCWRPVVLPPCMFKTRKNCFLFSKTEKQFSRWFALFTLSSLHATIPNTEKTSLLYLFNSWPWAAAHRRSWS